MKLLNFSFLLLILGGCCSSYKIIIFVPTQSNSQVVLNCRIGDLLADAGHDVTLYRAQMNPSVHKIKPRKAKELRVPNVLDGDRFLRMQEQQHAFVFKDPSIFAPNSSDLFHEYISIFIDACKAQVINKKLLSELESEQFDLAIAHMYDFCPMGLIHRLKIPSYIWMSSAMFLEYMAWVTGTPSPPSFVPGVLSASSDRMSYIERVKNFLGTNMAIQVAISYMAPKTTALFREEFGSSFPDVVDLAAKSPLVFINSVELIDFPRPILHKTVYIGGIGMEQAAPLKPEWQKLMDSSTDGVILMSFGSVANSSGMPLEWKESFLQSFQKFPSYTFVWKYEADDLNERAAKMPNLFLSNWVPQRDMLAHPKLRALITHGGYNSVLESAHAGVPLVMVPLFGDQFRNAQAAQRHGFGINIQKYDIKTQTITDAIAKVLQDENYARNAKRLKRMLSKRPVKSEELVVNWVEFLAEFKRLPNLEVMSTQLSLIQYFSLDVIAGIVGAMLIAAYALYRLAKWFICAICRKISYEKIKTQ